MPELPRRRRNLPEQRVHENSVRPIVFHEQRLLRTGRHVSRRSLERCLWRRRKRVRGLRRGDLRREHAHVRVDLHVPVTLRKLRRIGDDVTADDVDGVRVRRSRRDRIRVRRWRAHVRVPSVLLVRGQRESELRHVPLAVRLRLQRRRGHLQVRRARCHEHVQSRHRVRDRLHDAELRAAELHACE